MIKEVARVLKKNGKFINVSRTDPAQRLYRQFSFLGFERKELRELALKANLCPDPDKFINISQKCGLELIDIIKINSNSSYEKAIYILEK